jgi:hypothetical protein
VESRCSSAAERAGSEQAGEGEGANRRKDRPNTTRLRRRRMEKGMMDHQSR